MPRNRKIAECFYYAGFIERWGSGTLRMIEELKAANLPIPKFKSETGHFRLIFFKLLSQTALTELGLSERQFKAIAYVKEHGSITNTIYQTVTGASKRTASRELNDLKFKKILISEGTSGRGIVYKIKGPMGP